MDQPANTTPGPWRVVGSFIESVPTGVDVAVSSGGFKPTDLLLIAAAPELYDALFRLVDRIEGCTQEEEPIELYDSPEHLEAIAALRRAGWTK